MRIKTDLITVVHNRLQHGEVLLTLTLPPDDHQWAGVVQMGGSSTTNLQMDVRWMLQNVF